MASKVIVYSPNEYMGIQKMFVYVNGKDQGVIMGQSSKHEFDVPSGATVVGRLGKKMYIDSNLVSIRDESVVELQFSIVQGGWKNSLAVSVVNERPMSDHCDKPIEKSVFEFDGGVGDRLTVFEDRIVIKHKGVLNFMAMGIHGDKVVYFSDITGIQFKPGGMTSGHLQFSILGGIESKGGIMNAASDENTITFTAQKNREAQEIHEYLNNKLRELKTAKNTPIIQAAPTSAADELKKFKELLDMGVITQEEFDAKKKQLLGL